MMMACFPCYAITICGSEIRSGIVDGIVEVDEKWGGGLVAFRLCEQGGLSFMEVG